MSPRQAREGCIALASHTGWQLSELLSMTGEDFVQWLEACPKE